MIEVGAVCGRFQIFHNDHLDYVLAAKKRCRHLIVGITNPDASSSPVEAVDRHRSELAANPFTYYERMKMVELAILEAGVPREEFDIVPFPISKPEMIRYYIPDGTTVFVTILDPWGHAKTARLKDFGYPVEVLWERNDKFISSSMLRQCIFDGSDWSEWVPEATHRYILENGFDHRIRDLMK